ncbi:Retrovirus-related Pol Polyprotein from transposon TNT 1-94 [Phytophthora cinnamomi]|uniref:Retrovirus-related Pol Polyprotein from transposon TNT 1-94 n=1 Tax=Phytophthora cinnamomi TaxID=4785 RepID=UPI00355AC48E|nr:Retrovirus-related Pol Polyprotein from transposon TNT 1-94 [Phytophthora cinnamomi]
MVDDGRGNPIRRDFVVDNVYYVPGFESTLLAVSTLVKTGHGVEFSESSGTVYNGNRRRVGCVARLLNGVYSVITEEDAGGPVSKSRNGKRYIMVVVWRDYVSAYGLKRKSEAAQAIKQFLALIVRHAEVQASSINVLRTDGGAEFLNKDVRKLIQ